MSTTVPDGIGGVPPATYTRKATGLVREIPFLDQAIFNASNGPPVNAIVFGLYALIIFPRANIYVTLVAAPIIGLSVWATFALMSAAIPRLGGDYTFNSRVLNPWIGLAGNVGSVIAAALGAGLNAYFFATQGLSPALSVIGQVAGSDTLRRWGGDFSSDHKTIGFFTSVIVIVAMSLVAIHSTKSAVRVVSVMFIVASIGLVISTVILLFTSRHGFVKTVDDAAGPGTYAKTVSAVKGKGLLPSDGGYSTSATIGAIYYMVTTSIWFFWGTYTASEFKRAGRRGRQLRSMVGTGVVQSVLVLGIVVIFLHTVGYNFFISSLNGGYTASGGLDTSASYAYYAALIAGNTLVVAVLAFAFVGWWIPVMYTNAAMLQRAFVTWSLDGLLPKRLADVSARTATPVIAIAIAIPPTIACAGLAAYYASFSQIFALITLFGFLPIVLVGVSAAVMRRRRADLYVGSPAEWRVAGIELLAPLGALCAVTGAVLMFLALYFHTALGIKHVVLTALLPALLFPLSAIWYYGARAVSMRRGVDIDLIYKEIPPE